MRLRARLGDWATDLYDRFLVPPAPNDRGNRQVEYSWIAAQIPPAQKGATALDFGAGKGWIGLLAARRGYSTTAIDLRALPLDYIHEKLTFRQQDLVQEPTPKDSYNLILNCSTIEHVGLRRYGNKLEDDEGDFKAMGILLDSLQDQGRMLFTTSVGQEAVFPGKHRIYDKSRLTRLLKGWKTIQAEYWIKNVFNQWIMCSASEAFAVKGSEDYYGLTLLVLRKVSS